MLARRLPVPVVSNGEVQCPRKGQPFVTAISVSGCDSIYRQSPGGCDQIECFKHRAAKAELVLLRRSQLGEIKDRAPRLRKDASEVREDQER